MKDCIAIDLDGTLIRGNSLKKFAVFSLKRLWAQRKFTSFCFILYIIIKRRLKLISHKQMKHSMLTAIEQHLSTNDIIDFAARLTAFINPSVKKIIDNATERDTLILLATAAPDLYVTHFAPLAGISNYIATKMTSSCDEYIENRGLVKRDAAIAFAMNNNAVITTVITDHYDDMPLITSCKEKVIIVSPDKSTLNQLKQSGLKFELL